jgi:hypothetical protein
MFGKEATKSLEIIECDPNGKNSKPALCKREKITGYPTWIVKGHQYTGVQSLEALANISDYKGSRDFINPNPEAR